MGYDSSGMTSGEVKDLGVVRHHDHHFGRDTASGLGVV
jgi:hypothetical protein